MNISLIGPKLENYDHKTEEKVFLEEKNKVHSLIFEEKPDNDHQIFQNKFLQALSPINTENPLITDKNLNAFFDSKIEPVSPKQSMNSKVHTAVLFRVFGKAKQLAARVKNVLYYKDFRNMTNFQISILNDLTVFIERKFVFRLNVHFIQYFFSFLTFFFQNLSCLQNVYFKPIHACSSIFQRTFYFNRRFIYSLKKIIRPINPDIKTMKIWNIFIVILTFLNFFIFTLEICFFGGHFNPILFSSYQIVRFLKIINFLCYGFDIFLNFFTGYHVGGALVMKLRLIKKKYLSTLFWFDFIAYLL